MDEKERLLRRLVELEEKKVPKPLTKKQLRLLGWLMGVMVAFYGALIAWSFLVN